MIYTCNQTTVKMQFHNILNEWYLKNKRELPWRQTRDPYQIWLSEIILQQTRVAQGLPYYLKFLEEFPTVFELADAPQQKVLKQWQGLGYYSRARNLHTTAHHVAYNLKGIFPGNYKDLLKLKGIGDYTASAIASTCYKEAVPVIDGNVYRVLARYFGIDTPINSTAGIKEFKELATLLLDREKPELYNQAVMEMGSTQCKPQNPVCEICPLSGGCMAYKEGKVSQLPVKLKKLKIKKRYFNYLVLLSEENKILVEQRKGKGIWEGLYQFPLIESAAPLGEQELRADEKFLLQCGDTLERVNLFNDSPVVHKLTHQHIYTNFWVIEKKQLPETAVSMEQLLEYPVPVLIANFIKEINLVEY